MSSNALAKKIRYALRFLPDEVYIQLNYFAHFKKFVNLKNPQTYNEKLNWLKLHDRNPLYTTLVDKYEVKEYVDKLIGPGYTVPTLGIWSNTDEINFDVLPDQFVLKCTHDSEGVVICKDKSKLDVEVAKKKLRAALRQNFYYIGREWPYKNVKPRIIAEEYLEDHQDGELRDYKFFCFHGEPRVMSITSDRGIGNTKIDYFDMDFNHLDLVRKYPNASVPLSPPSTFELMIAFAKRLSTGFPHIRVDFYEANGRLYLGELTLYTSSGFVPFCPEKWDKRFGDWLEIPLNSR